MLHQDRRSDRQHGQGLTEFALVLPILLLLMIALFDVGRVVILYSALTNAAREGARLAIVNQDVALVEERVQAMTFTGEIANLGSVVAFVRESDPSLDCTPLATGCLAVVTPEVDWTAITPLISDLIGPITLQVRAEMPIEFVCPNPRIAAYLTSDACPKQP